MKYAIVIPTYNHCDDLLKPCIESIIRNTRIADQPEIELIVVANGCTDNTAEYLQELRSRNYAGNPAKWVPFTLHIIWEDKPLGYTKAVNLGILKSIELGSDYTIMMNNDVTLLDFAANNRWLEILTRPFNNPRMGMVGTSKIIDETTNVAFIIFYMAMIKTAIFTEIGLLDEVFNPGFGEDIDFAIRLQRAGYNISRVPVEGTGYDYTETFPLYHGAEKTMHDEKSNLKTVFGLSWDEIIERNKKILKERYATGTDWLAPSPFVPKKEEPENNWTDRSTVKYSVIIPTYNHCDDLLVPCLNSVLENTNLNETEVVVVANGCTDNTQSTLEKYPNVKTIWFDEQLGYTKAVNEGIKNSTGEYVVLLNNDTQVLDKTWLSILEEPFTRDVVTMGVTGPRLEHIGSFEYLLFFCVMIRRSVIDKVGLLDEAFNPGGFEDADFCIRAVKNGFMIQEVPVSESVIADGMVKGGFPIYHIGGGTVRHIEGWRTHMEEKLEMFQKKYAEQAQPSLPDGFFNDDNIFRLRELTEQMPDGGVMVQLGVWLGRSLFCLSDIIKRKNIKVVAVDTFVGSEGDDPMIMQFSAQADIEHLFKNFINVFGLKDNVETLRMTTDEAVLHFKDKSVDLLFIDANHTSPFVDNDVFNWKTKVKDDGIICGHDYFMDSVKRAVHNNFKPEFIHDTYGIWHIDPNRPKVYDCFMFFNEFDALELRLNELNTVVDYFVLVEGIRTHVGTPKPLFFQENKQRFSKYLHKIIYVGIADFPEYDPRKQFDLEIHQRNAISWGLTECRDQDIVIIADVDEIPSAKAILAYQPSQGICNLSQRIFYYYLNCAMEIPWLAAKIGAFKFMKSMSPHEIRNMAHPVTIEDGGWHFSFLGGIENIILKVQSYVHSEFNNDQFLNLEHLTDALKNGKDIFKRDIELTFVDIDDTYPKHILNHMDYYKSIGFIKNTKPMKTLDEIKDFVNNVGTENVELFGGSFVGGYRLQQDINELSNFLFDHQELEIKNYLEIGVAAGGMARVMCDILNIENIVTLDLGIHLHADYAQATYRENMANLKNSGTVYNITADSHSTDALNELCAQNKRYNLIFVDGDHTYLGAKEDLLLAMLFSAEESIIVMHDEIAVPELDVLFGEVSDGLFEGLEVVKEYVGTGVTKKGIGVFKYKRPFNWTTQYELKNIRLELLSKYLPNSIVNFVVPTYNRHEELKRALSSIKAQTYNKIKVWVCADGEDEVVKEITNTFDATDAYTAYHYLALPEHEGLLGSKPRMMGINATSSIGVTCFLDDDNVIYPNYVEKLFRAIRSDGNYQGDESYIPDSNIISYCVIKHSHSPHPIPAYGHVEGFFEHSNIDTLNIMVNSYVAKQCVDQWQHVAGEKIVHDFNFITECAKYGKAVFVNEILADHCMSMNKDDIIVTPTVGYQPKVLDGFLFFNEFDTLELRLNELNDVVDKFVLVESNITFTGNPKPYYFEENKERFAKFLPKITHIKVDQSTDTPASAWDVEHFQRNCIYRGFKECNNNDIVMISDVDEIPSVAAIKSFKPSQGVVKLRQTLCYYYLNCQSDFVWYGTRIALWGIIKTQTASHIRQMIDVPTVENGGWHFSYIGGTDNIVKKIEAFSHQEFNTPLIKDKDRLSNIIAEGKDLFDRDIKFNVVGVNNTFPRYVVENYNELIKRNMIKEGEVSDLPKSELPNRKLLKDLNGFVFDEVWTHDLYAVKAEEVANKVVVDIGAHFGYFGFRCLELGAKAVHYFEPHPHNLVTLNRLAGNLPNAYIHKVAVTDGAFPKMFMRFDDVTADVFADESGIPVDCVSFTEAVTNISDTDNNMVLKMDCEGSEYEILLHTPVDILLRFSHIYIEIHDELNPHFMHQTEMLIGYLQQIGFKAVYKAPQFGTWFPDKSFKPFPVVTYKFERVAVLNKPEWKSRVYDCFMFNDELDVLDIRFEELDSVVDYFVIVESPLTHSGKPKPLYFKENMQRYAKYLPKIRHYIFTDMPQTDNAWHRESHQRDACAQGLYDAKDYDIIISGDADEIPKRELIRAYDPHKGAIGIETKYYFYFLNCQRQDKGTTHLRLVPFWLLKRYTFCFFRYKDYPIIPDGGWHFSFIGDVKQIKKKIESYAHQEYNTPHFTDEDRLSRIINEGGDILEKGMVFKFVDIDDTFPQYIINNKDYFIEHKNIKLVESETPQPQSSNLRDLEPLTYDEMFGMNIYDVQPDEMKDATVIDIGANYGFFAMIAVEMGAKSVHCYEPELNNYNTLRKLTQNIPQIKTNRLAVFDGSLMYTKISDAGIDSNMWDSNAEQLVVCTSLKDILSQPDVQSDKMVLKMDCEGAEYEILYTTPIALLRKFGWIYIEIHDAANPNYKNKSQELLFYLKKIGFDMVYSAPQLYSIDPVTNINQMPMPMHTYKLQRAKAKVYDGFLFFNELDLLELRLKELNDVVDKFVLVESNTTFTGKPKPYYFEENKERFKAFEDKIIHIKTVNNLPPEASPWDVEYYQRDAIYQGLTDCRDFDIVMIMDIDEIPNPDVIKTFTGENGVSLLQQKTSFYYFNCVANFFWWNPKIGLWQDVKKESATNIRNNNVRPVIENGGWHFTALGGIDAILEKLDAFSHKEYNTEHFRDRTWLEEKIKQGIDVYERIGTTATYQEIDDSFPAEIRNNKEYYIKKGYIYE